MSSDNDTTYWNIDRIMKLIIGLAIATAIVFFIRALSNVLLPFFAACFIAYMLQPLVQLNRRLIHEKGRAISSILSLLEVTGVIALVVYLFLPHVVNELDNLSRIIHDVTSGRRPLPKEYVSIVQWADKTLDFEKIKSQLSQINLDSLLSKGMSILGDSLSMLGEMLEWALTIIYILFILIDYPQIVKGFKLAIPHKYRNRVLPIVRDVQINMNHYFRGQGYVAMFAAVFYCIGFSIVGLPLAIPMGLLVGVLYMIPYFQYVTLIPVALICSIYSLGGGESFISLFGKSLLVYVVSQSICDYIITPHIMGKELGLNPAIILLSLSIWGSLLGIIGMIIALPVTSLIMAYYEKYISFPRKKVITKINTDESFDT